MLKLLGKDEIEKGQKSDSVPDVRIEEKPRRKKKKKSKVKVVAEVLVSKPISRTVSTSRHMKVDPTMDIFSQREDGRVNVPEEFETPENMDDNVELQPKREFSGENKEGETFSTGISISKK